MPVKKIHLLGESLLELGVRNKNQYWPNCQSTSVQEDHITMDLNEVTCLICLKDFAFHNNRPELLLRVHDMQLAYRDAILAK